MVFRPTSVRLGFASTSDFGGDRASVNPHNLFMGMPGPWSEERNCEVQAPSSACLCSRSCRRRLRRRPSRGWCSRCGRGTASTPRGTSRAWSNRRQRLARSTPSTPTGPGENGSYRRARASTFRSPAAPGSGCTTGPGPGGQTQIYRCELDGMATTNLARPDELTR
jgi:hypothetical protein